MKQVMCAAIGTTGGARAGVLTASLLAHSLGFLVFLGCGGLGVREDASLPPGETDSTVPATEAGGTPSGEIGGTPGDEAGGTPSGGEVILLGSPLSFAPTAHGFGLNAVLAEGSPAVLRARVRATGTADWGAEVPAASRTADIAQWIFDGLAPGLRYDYEVLAPDVGGEKTIYAGSAVTQRQPGETFTFALITDSHIGSDLSYTNQGDPHALEAVSAEVGAASPDFMVHLGDMLDFHEYGFNDPPPEGSITRQAYLNYRTLLGDTLGRTSHFATIGNWEGENGCYSPEEIDRSMEQRLLYLPGPQPTSYPEGGSPNEDYYAFTWGDALFVVLNVMGYTPTKHLLSIDPGLPDDWTLGPVQLAWLSSTLANAKSKWRFLLIHHPVGGKAGDDSNSAYGRGGGQAAYVGEQATIHQLMLLYGAQIFFYGHDHVFTDMTVDGIHYSDAGNAGAVWMFDKSITGYTQSWLTYGWTKVTVSPATVNVQFIDKAGDLLYEYALP